MKLATSGTSQAQLTVPDFSKMRIPLPPLPLQEEFARFAEQADKSQFTSVLLAASLQDCDAFLIGIPRQHSKTFQQGNNSILQHTLNALRRPVLLTTETLVNEIERRMLPLLNNWQREHLHETLKVLFSGVVCTGAETIGCPNINDNGRYLGLFISAKTVEGCSERTLRYYKTTLDKALLEISLPVPQITTDDLRSYLESYQHAGKTSQVTVDNVRRILSSFFSWLEEEDHIVKSPMRRIHKVRSCKTVKATFTDEELEEMRDNCGNTRDLALIDLLSSTGMRVGELVGLDRDDVDLERRECIVLGKGNKQRVVYFDARTKVHLKNYLASRSDSNEALFVALQTPNGAL